MIFDFYFFRMYWWNTRVVNSGIPIFSATIGVSAMIFMNSVFFIELISVLGISIVEQIIFRYIYILATIVLIFNVNYFYYNKRYLKIINRFEKISKIDKKKLDYICLTYTILTLILFWWAFIHAREHYVS